MLTLDLICQAQRRLRGLVHRTPLVPSATLSAHLGARVYLKLECLQKTGSFKPRGAFNKMLTLTPEEWPPSGIKGLKLIEGSEEDSTRRVWTTSELLSTQALVAEGRAMRHCVATYAHYCAHGACSIWTLEAETLEGRSKILTVEVQNETRQICQVRGKCNALPAEKHRHILRRWAEQARLQLADYV